MDFLRPCHILIAPRPFQPPAPPQATSQDFQYLLGGSLLAAPVLTEGSVRQDVYLPQSDGQWFDLWSWLAYDEADGRFRIGSAPILSGGQSITVQAPLDALPLFVRAGTILPTLDPSVSTLNPATHANVTSYFERRDVLHLWVWPDADLSADSGCLWDGARFRVQPSKDQKGLVFVSEDVVGHRALLLQVVIGERVVSGVEVTQGLGKVELVGGWEEVVAMKGPQAGYAVDRRQGTLWMRVPGHVDSLDVVFAQC